MKEKSKKIEKKNLIIIGIFIISIIIILFGGALLYNKFFYKKSFTEVETIMLNAAKTHFNKHEEKLPKNIGDSITITDETLVKNNEMNTIESYIKTRNITCSGEVTVTNINGNHRYTSVLDCGKNYQTKLFSNYIKENVKIVNDGNGLYKLNDQLVYRGDEVKNYLKLNGKTYRIVKFVNDHPVIIYTDFSDSIQWDNRYNINTDDNAGINDYEISRMRSHLNNLYNKTGENALLSDTNRLLVTSYNLPIGKRSNKDTDKTGKLEQATVLTDQYIGLLPVSDFLNASLDKNCTSTTSQSCENYNYLNRYKYTWWTITANSTNTYKVYVIDKIPYTTQPDSYAYIRPVLYLVNDAIYVSGDGSNQNPYIIK